MDRIEMILWRDAVLVALNDEWEVDGDHDAVEFYLEWAEDLREVMND